MRPILFMILLLGPGNHYLYSQSKDTLTSILSIDFESRPRAEFRNNFRWTNADSSLTELYVSQRNRLNITYQNTRFKFHISPQEIHLWGKAGEISRIGSINAFEFYIEPTITKHISLRVGRQALSLDNGRIFSAAPWSQQGRSHEGIRLIYNDKISTDLTLVFTRPYGKSFESAYSPVASHQYKFMAVHHFKQQFKNNLRLTTINTLEVLPNSLKLDASYQRITNGGRLEYTADQIYGTLNAYYQYGRTTGSKTIRAYYLQPEISTNVNKITVRLGAEILSGSQSGTRAGLSNSFIPLYGVAWKFMGNMNLFTRFPADVNDRGLINPYLFWICQMNRKLTLRADFHLFYSQFQLDTKNNGSTGKYLGFENDLSFNYRPLKQVEITFGISSTFAGQSMELLNKVPDANKVALWSYLMFSYSPQLLSIKK
ncbi:Alginate export [Dyadobacter koreensis]|uniref:Alginate export n=2 Tax=Dyadobacter koreensis TaxID=408657 RepID=A0A1H6VD66_9BACT|nr:Alginate export [Dyadobacter koreensis]